jgi:hypothetical protein
MTKSQLAIEAFGRIAYMAIGALITVYLFSTGVL